MEQADFLTKLKKDGFSSEIISAFRNVDREKFVLPAERVYVNEDIPLSIGHGQTNSQPSTIAFMLSLFRPAKDQKILEVGSGSGYVLALLSELTGGSVIFGVELIPELVIWSRKNLSGYANVKIRQAETEVGLEAEAPFDRILVSADAREVPEDLLSQLGEGGIIVCPIKNTIWKAVRTKSGFKTESYVGFRFVPLIYKTKSIINRIL